MIIKLAPTINIIRNIMYIYIYSSNIHIYITSTYYYSYGTYTSCSSRILHKQGFKEKPSQDFFLHSQRLYTKKRELSFEKLMLKRKNNILKIYRNCQFKVKLFKIVSYLCTIVLIILIVRKYLLTNLLSAARN